MMIRTDSAARPPQPQDGARVSRVVGGSLDGPRRARYCERYGADPQRFTATEAATVAQPVKIDNALYVRDYAKCILCYKCVEACGTDAQNTFAIAVAGRGFDAHISTEYDVPLPDSACVYCGNCIGVCPTGALMFSSEHELRERGEWNEAAQTQTDTDLPLLRRRLHAHAARAGERDRQGHVADRERRTTSGHLCVKGRFGYHTCKTAPTDD